MGCEGHGRLHTTLARRHGRGNLSEARNRLGRGPTRNWVRRSLLNILLSFAQFEREMIAERTRDKMSAARKRGKYIGGMQLLGYDIDDKA